MAVASDLILDRLRQARPCFWKNSAALSQPLLDDPLGHAVDEAEDRLKRSTRLLWALFPGLKDAEAPIKSPLVAAGTLGVALGATPALAERLWVKADHQLPIAGSVKARGGFHEVIAIAEKIALGEGLIVPGSDLAALDRVEARTLFSKHSIVVGSTGNLGMSIGLIASALGFRAVVHMSSGAKAWKKDRLRRHGAEVVEHRGDYAQAVLYGRQAAEADRFSHFVDDEQSIDLFTGYAAAARELVSQLRQNNIAVDADHPLFVYIPCGVGGAPGGIAYGLKRLLGPHVHCLFAEPVQSPCMLVQLASGSDDPVSVYDLGLTNRTEADGLAVGQASMLVSPLMRHRLDALFTVSDDQLYALFAADESSQRLGVEPSAAACFAGPLVLDTPAGRQYLEQAGLTDKMARASHVLWTTGGSLVPEEERQSMRARAMAAPHFDLAVY
jgi:D-serine dehydratase